MILNVGWRTFYPRYTNSLKLALYYAVGEARLRGARKVSVDDLLLGLTHNSHAEDCPFRVLQDRAQEVRESLGRERLPNDWLIRVKSLAQNPLRPELPVKRVLRVALIEAKKDGQFWIDTDHLQRAILREGGKPAAALQSLGFTFEETERFGAQGRMKYPPKAPTLGTRIRQYKPAVPWLAFLVGFVGAILYLHSQN